jgi:hypothetical protein
MKCSCIVRQQKLSQEIISIIGSQYFAPIAQLEAENASDRRPVKDVIQPARFSSTRQAEVAYEVRRDKRSYFEWPQENHMSEQEIAFKRVPIS